MPVRPRSLCFIAGFHHTQRWRASDDRVRQHCRFTRMARPCECPAWGRDVSHGLVRRPRTILGSLPGTGPGRAPSAPTTRSPTIYIDLVRAMERACFDYVMIEDGSFVPERLTKGAPEWYLHNASYGAQARSDAAGARCWPRDRAISASVATMTTRLLSALLAARLGATLDHLTRAVSASICDGAQRPDGAEFRPARHHEHDSMRCRIADAVDPGRRSAAWQS